LKTNTKKEVMKVLAEWKREIEVLKNSLADLRVSL
jgi:hypothetical protein